MRKIGIIGGMGPEATLDLFRKIVTNTPANSDQEHLPILIDNIPQIHDRTTYLIHGGPNPYPQLLESAKYLERSGVDAICMPCNTAHYFLKDLQQSVSTPFISIIESTYRAIIQDIPNAEKIGLFATSGTTRTQIYHRVFQKGGIDIIDMSETDQQALMEIIYGVKAGKIQDQVMSFQALIEKAATRGVEAFIAGCTEIPLLLKFITSPVPFYDPTLILAKEVVSFGHATHLSK